MGERIAMHNEPGSIAMLVKPQLMMQPGRIIALVDIVVEIIQGIRVLPIGSIEQCGVTEIRELSRVTQAKQWMVYSHKALNSV
jgi:hypothetical protein